jgi:preprotein translocase subunit SecF
MRRLLAYITLAISMLLCIGVAATPVLTQIQSDITYSDGVTATFRLTEKEDGNQLLDNSAKSIGEEMSSRLSAWGASNYNVVAEGNDTIEATFSATQENEYEDIENYLAFSGQNYSISSQDDKINFVGDEMFKDSVARIEYYQYAPIVVIPVSDGTKLKEAIDNYGKDSTDTNSVMRKADEEDTGFKLELWANRKEGESYADITEQGSDSPVAKKILFEFTSTNIFYTESAEGKENTELQIICGKTDDNGNYDTNYTAQANYTANKYLRMFNASKLNYDVEMLYSTVATAQVENLLTYGLTVNVATSKTLIATLILIVMMCLILALFYRVASIGGIATTLSVGFLSLTFFILFGVQFNVAALVGLVLVLGVSLFSVILYNSKLKEEIYRGRSLKKANSEASKRSTMPILDVSIASVVIGLLIYLMGGSLVSSLGILLILGGAFNAVINLPILKIMMWLVTNSTNMQGNWKAFNVEEKLVPSIGSEKKAAYQGIYQDKDLTKHKKVSAILSGAFIAISVVMMIVFGVTTGSIYNLNSNYANNSKIYIAVSDTNSEIIDANYLEKNVLPNVYVNDKQLAYTSVVHETNEAWDKDLKDYSKKTEYYIVTIDAVYADDQINSYYVIGDVKSDVSNLQDTLSNYIEGEVDTTSVVSLKVENAVATQTITTNVIWATLIGMAIVAIYYMIRYRISRGLSAIIISVGSGFITMGLFSVTRIVCTPIVTLSAIAVAFFTLLGVTYYLSREREMRKESKNRNQILTKEDKHQMMVKATSVAAGPLVVITLTMAYFAINYFGFGPTDFAIMFGGIVIGVVIAALLIVSLAGPIADLFERMFSHIRIKLPEKKAKKNKNIKPKSAEPEESPVIGINV